MKTIIKCLAAAFIVTGMTACSNSNSPLTASYAKKAIKKEAEFNKHSQVREFMTGFQEVSESELQDLARLKAAGVITYTTEKAVETRSKREWRYFSGYVTTTTKHTHVFANVTLTDAGRKLVVEKPVRLREDKIKDMADNENYEEPTPDYMEASDNAFDTNAVQQVQEADSTVEITEEMDVCEEYVETASDEAEEAPATQGEADPNAAYNAMLARISTETHNVLLGHYEVVKVKEVLCTDEMFKAGKGSCTLLYKFVDKTPFGYVFGAPSEDYILTARVKFNLYQDLGWTVAND